MAKKNNLMSVPMSDAEREGVRELATALATELGVPVSDSAAVRWAIERAREQLSLPAA